MAIPTAGLGAEVIDLFDLGETINDVIRATDKFLDNPSPENSAELVKIASTQLAGQLIGQWLDKVIPNNGGTLDLVFDALKDRFNNPISRDDFVAQRAFKKAAAGYIIGKMIEKGVDAAIECDWLKEKVFFPIFEFTDDIADFVNSLFRNASTYVPPPVDPLALDLDGDGIETTGIAGYNTILFDHDGDGVKTGTGWVKGDDAFLALDRNGNGTIDDGGELFGVDTVMSNGQKAANGFAALADLDSNGDGIFSSADAQYAHVRLWRDLDQDGISDEGELLSLEEAGIASINLASTAANTNLGNGNTQTAKAAYTRTDGTTGTAGNLNLAENAFYREFTDAIPLTDAAKTLPGMAGAGNDEKWRRAA